MTEYSNPRTEAVIKDWPNGGKRVEARFYIEKHPKRGERAVRETTGAPKKLTFASQARIVDGDDGRTYIIERSIYGSITVMKGDMKYEHEHIPDRDPRHAAVLALFNQPGA